MDFFKIFSSSVLKESTLFMDVVNLSSTVFGSLIWIYPESCPKETKFHCRKYFLKIFINFAEPDSLKTELCLNSDFKQIKKMT